MVVQMKDLEEIVVFCAYTRLDVEHAALTAQTKGAGIPQLGAYTKRKPSNYCRIFIFEETLMLQSRIDHYRMYVEYQ